MYTYLFTCIYNYKHKLRWKTKNKKRVLGSYICKCYEIKFHNCIWMGKETHTHPHPHKTQTLNGVGVKGLVEHRRRKGLLWVSTAYRKQRITSTSETETERGRQGKREVKYSYRLYSSAQYKTLSTLQLLFLSRHVNRACHKLAWNSAGHLYCWSLRAYSLSASNEIEY